MSGGETGPTRRLTHEELNEELKGDKPQPRRNILERELRRIREEMESLRDKVEREPTREDAHAVSAGLGKRNVVGDPFGLDPAPWIKERDRQVEIVGFMVSHIEVLEGITGQIEQSIVRTRTIADHIFGPSIEVAQQNEAEPEAYSSATHIEKYRNRIIRRLIELDGQIARLETL